MFGGLTMDIVILITSFIICTITIYIVVYMANATKQEKPINKVHFYVTCGLDTCGYIIYSLWLGNPTYTEDKSFVSNIRCRLLAVNSCFNFYNLNYTDFEYMKQGEIREVFLNLDD